MKPNVQHKIVFFGTPEFALPTLEALVKAKYQLLVVTQPDKPVGRSQALTPPPVKQAAIELKLEIIQPANLRDNQTVVEQIKNFEAQVGVIIAYAKIIPQKILDLFPRGVLNIHPSLLPKYRGPSPIQTAILNGDQKTGVSIMVLDEQMDHGPILEQQEIEIGQDDTGQSLHDKLSQLGAKLLISTLQDYLLGRLQPWQQDHSQASATKLIDREDGQVDWSQKAEQIQRQFRAFYPWPGLWTIWQEKRLKIAEIGLTQGKIVAKPVTGRVILGSNDYPAVQTKKGLIILRQVQLEGKNQQDGKDFVRGHKDFIGSQLGQSA